MAKKTDADRALEMYQSVMQSNNKQKKLRSETFWGLFNVGARHETVVEKIEKIINEQGLKITVRSDAPFGKEKFSDWIILTPKSIIPPPPPIIDSVYPSPEWFEMMQTRQFESEREVEAYFIAPLLEKLGYDYDDIVIGYSFEMFKGVTKTKPEADFVTFNGTDRTKENVLLVVEAKKSDKGISVDHIGQARSYAVELSPASYIVSNGQQIIVFQFNGTLIPDERVMDFDRSELHDKWGDLYNYTSKQATIQRNLWMEEQISKMKAGNP